MTLDGDGVALPARESGLSLSKPVRRHCQETPFDGLRANGGG